MAAISTAGLAGLFDDPKRRVHAARAAREVTCSHCGKRFMTTDRRKIFCNYLCSQREQYYRRQKSEG